MKKIFVIVKRPFEPVGRIKEIDNTLEALQEIVGGFNETFTLTPDLVVICDEEGRLKGKPHNCRVMGTDLAGPIIVAGIKGDEFTDCPLDLDDWQRYWIGRKDCYETDPIYEPGRI